MERVLPRDDVTFEADLWRVPGLLVIRPIGGQASDHPCTVAGFNFGSAKAYRHLVGHIAARAVRGRLSRTTGLL